MESVDMQRLDAHGEGVNWAFGSFVWTRGAVWFRVLGVTGAMLNAAGIVIGCLAGWRYGLPLSPQRQRHIQILLGAFTVFVGLSIAWAGLRGSPGQFLGKTALMLLALMLGKLTGQWLRIQRRINRAGGFARGQIDQGTPAQRLGDGFLACVAIYCLAPLALLGALAEGLRGDLRPLVIKTIMDSLAAMSFGRTLRAGLLLSAIPVFVWEGTLALGGRFLLPWLEDAMLVDSILATTGFLVFAVALVILRLRRIELADYWPSLVYAPLLAMVFR